MSTYSLFFLAEIRTISSFYLKIVNFTAVKVAIYSIVM